MSASTSTKRTVDLKEVLWVKLPTTGHVAVKLDKSGAGAVAGVDPGFGDAPYCVYLGLRAGAGGPTRYGTLDGLREGDYLYAEVHQSGTFDIHVKMRRSPEVHPPTAGNVQNQGDFEPRSLADSDPTVDWWAVPQSSSCYIGPSYGPTPTPRPIGQSPVRAGAADSQGPAVSELPNLSPELVRRLTEAKMTTVAAVACADATHVAQILGFSEVLAMKLIHEAGSLLQGQTRE